MFNRDYTIELGDISNYLRQILIESEDIKLYNAQNGQFINELISGDKIIIENQKQLYHGQMIITTAIIFLLLLTFIERCFK